MDECNHVTLCDIKVCRISHAHDSEQRAFCPGSIPIQISSNARQNHSATRYDANMQAKPPKSAKDSGFYDVNNAVTDACHMHVQVPGNNAIICLISCTLASTRSVRLLQ